MARHRFDISSKGAVLPGCNDAEMGPANSLHASAYYSEYNERFDVQQANLIQGQQSQATCKFQPFNASPGAALFSPNFLILVAMR